MCTVWNDFYGEMKILISLIRGMILKIINLEYMTIDIHKTIGKLPIIPKKGFTLPNMNYCGPYNPLDKQVIYDENGNIIKYIQNPTGKTDAICAQHDIDYALSRNINDKHNADKRMINSINNLP